MMTDDGLLTERANGNVGGSQRLYRWGGWGLSVVNGAMLHAYSFAREIAVVRFTDKRGENDFELSYETPLTNDVEVFRSDEEANEFVERARAYFASADIDALNAAQEKAQAEREATSKRLREEWQARKNAEASQR